MPEEWRRLKRAMGRLDPQTVVVLVAAAALIIVQHTAGSRRVFVREFAQYFAPEWWSLLSWGWWFGSQALTGFVVPVIVLLVVFRRTARQAGLGIGDWKFGLVVCAFYVPLVFAGTWILSDDAAFQSAYPHYQPAATSWWIFSLYHALFLFYWIGWEYLWRGFLLFGTAHTFGLYSIFVQALPFTILHLAKPVPELILSLVGGIALGALVWRCRSFWVAVPIHAAQMLILDFWCSMRIRTGVRGMGLGALVELFST